jgi:hypothetical protein
MDYGPNGFGPKKFKLGPRFERARKEALEWRTWVSKAQSGASRSSGAVALFRSINRDSLDEIEVAKSFYIVFL